MSKLLNIFEFSDYRIYLESWLKEAKRNKTFNLSRLAEVAQVHPTFLSHVLSGEKDLSLEQAAFISEHLAHTKLEKDYFFTLINLDRAGTATLREYWSEKKQGIEKEKNRLSQRFEKHREMTSEQRVIFYSNWLYLAIWISTAINEGQTLNQISQRFRISRTRSEEILAFLVQTGVCNDKNGTFSMGETHVHVPNESPFVVKHHMNWRMKAIQKMDSREQSELFFSAPMSIAKKDFEKIREKLNQVVDEVVEVAKKSPAEELVCLNIDYFFVETS